MAQQDQPNLDRAKELDNPELQDQKNPGWSDIPEPAGAAPPGGQSFGERIHDEPADEEIARAIDESEQANEDTAA